MLLIALSKKSHTYWRLIDDRNKIHQYQTLSLNSFFHTDTFDAVEKNQFPPIDLSVVEQLYFYSSECDSSTKCQHISNFLKQYFKSASLIINDDLIATAYGLCGEEKGIAATLGSNAQSGLFNGQAIIERIKTKEEEGSGSYLGKQLVQAYLDKKLPEGLVTLFIDKYKPIDEEFQAVVNKQILQDKEYMASMSPFLFRNIHHPYMAELVYESFVKFFDTHICVFPDYRKLKLHLSGAVAFYYGNILREVANDKGVTLGRIVEQPIAGLALYHLDKVKA